MGIYSHETIYGIQIYTFKDDDMIILFEEKYEQEMSNIQRREAYSFYNQLNDKTHLCYKIYTECSSTLSYNGETFMMWQPLPLDAFLQKFNI